MHTCSVLVIKRMRDLVSVCRRALGEAAVELTLDVGLHWVFLLVTFLLYQWHCVERKGIAVS